MKRSVHTARCKTGGAPSWSIRCGLIGCLLFALGSNPAAQDSVWVRVSDSKVQAVYGSEADAMQLPVAESNESTLVSCLEYEQAPAKEREPLNDGTASAGASLWCQQKMYRWIRLRLGEDRWLARRDYANNACQAVVATCGTLKANTYRLALFDWIQGEVRNGIESSAKSGDLLGPTLNEKIRGLVETLGRLEEQQIQLRKTVEELKKAPAVKTAAKPKGGE